MRKLTWKEAFGYGWWVLLILLAFVWMVELLISASLITGLVISTAVILIWIYGFIGSIRNTALKCECGIVFSRQLRNCPGCALEVTKELQE